VTGSLIERRADRLKATGAVRSPAAQREPRSQPPDGWVIDRRCHGRS